MLIWSRRWKRGGIVAAAIGALGVMPALAGAAGLQAGAGKAPVALPADLLPFQGFGVELDALQARAVVLDDSGHRSAIIVVDMTSLGNAEVRQFQALAQQIAGVAPDDALVVVSHTFSSPHIFGGPPPGAEPARGAGDAGRPDAKAQAGVPPAPARDDPAKAEAFKSVVSTAVRQALVQAVASLRPARLVAARSTSNVNVNRNLLGAQGWWLGADDQGPSDKTLQVLRLEDQAHRPIALLNNYAVQSSVMDQVAVRDGQKAITADLAGAAMDHVEKTLGQGVVSLFLVGAAGDQAPIYTARQHILDAEGLDHVVDLGAAAAPFVQAQGQRLGGAIVATQRDGSRPLPSSAKAQSIPPHVLSVKTEVLLPTQDRPREIAQIHATHAYTYRVTGAKKAVPFTIMRIGDVAIVGVQVELSASTGAWIRAHSPFPTTLVVTMVNGADKYLPDAKGYAQFTYEAMNSSYAPGSGERLADAIVASLKALKKTI